MKSIFAHFRKIKTVIDDISTIDSQKLEVQAEAGDLANRMRQIESAVTIILWHAILSRFSSTHLAFQERGIDLLTVVKLYNSLTDYITDLRDSFANV